MASIKQGIDNIKKNFVEANFSVDLADPGALNDLKEQTKIEEATLEEFWKDADDFDDLIR